MSCLIFLSIWSSFPPILAISLPSSQVSMASSFDSSSPTSSSSSGTAFSAFSLREKGIYSQSLPILPRMSEEDRISASSFSNSLSREREIALCYFVPLEVEIVVTQSGDDVLHPPILCCYVDHLKAGLHLLFFAFLVSIL